MGNYMAQSFFLTNVDGPNCTDEHGLQTKDSTKSHPESQFVEFKPSEIEENNIQVGTIKS